MAVCVIWPLSETSAVVTGVTLTVAAVVALALRSPAAVRAAIFFSVLAVIFITGILGDWPPALTTVLACTLPPAALHLAAGRAPWLRPATPWLTWGRPTRETPWLALATVLGAAVALGAWAFAVRPEPSAYLLGLQELPLWQALLGVGGFALVNPVWEEALFRGVLLTELATVWRPGVAVILQALVFGAAHWAGFPSGPAGMLMAAGWGLLLGIMRLRTGGIVISYLVHVAANATIGTLAITLLR